METFKNSVLMMIAQGKEMVEHLDLTEKLLAKEITSKESKLVLVEEKIKERDLELQVKESKVNLVNLVKKSFEEWSEMLSMKKEELGLVEKSIVEHRVEQSRLESVIKDCCEKIGLKEKELGEISSSIAGHEEELVMKENHVASFQSMIGEFAEVLEQKEKRLGEIEKSISLFEAKLERKNKKLELIRTSIEELRLEHRKEEEKLESVQGMVVQRQDDLEYIEDKLDSVRKRLKKYKNDVELKEREFNGVNKSIEESSQELTLKEKELKFVQESIEVCRKELQEKKDELISVGKFIIQCSEELELKKKQLCLIEKCTAELSDERESHELDLDLIQTMRIETLKQLEEKEKHFDSLKNALEDQLKDLESKERQFEKRVSEFESLQKVVEERSKNLELKEKKLSNILHSQVKTEQPESLKGNEGVRRLSLQSLSINDGRNLQLLLNQHLQKHDLVFAEVSHTIAEARDPAMLVLDAIQGFYHPHSREGGIEFDVGTIRRSCSIILEKLSNLRPEIKPEVQDEAMKMAGEWKKMMRVAEGSSFEVLGFLHLLDAYGLAPHFDRNELESLLDIVGEHNRQAQNLRQNFGFGDKVHGNSVPLILDDSQHFPVNDAPNYLAAGVQCSTAMEGRCSLPLRNKLDLGDTEVLQLLHMVPDPPMLVLDFIQGSCAEHWKTQGARFKEGSLHSCIRFLQKLKEVLPKMHPHVKPDAMKLAAEWKTKMGAGTENSLEILVFLHLLGTFELVVYFNTDEILELLWTISHHKEAPEVCRALGFMDIVPNFVRTLIIRRKHIEAVRFVCAFKLTDNFKPDAIFKEFWADAGRTISDIYREVPHSPDAKDKAIDIELNTLSVLIECVEENKLESFVRIDDLKQRLVQFEKVKVNRRHSAAAPSPTIKMQSAASMKLNVGSTAPNNQPVPVPMIQTQHGRMLHSVDTSAGSVQPVPSRMTQTQHNRMQYVGSSAPSIQPVTSPMSQTWHNLMQQGISTYVPREQPQVQKEYKRPRTEAPTIESYKPPVSAAFNQYRSSSAVQCSPALARCGRKTQFDHLASNPSMVTTNMGAEQPNIAGRQNLHPYKGNRF